MTRNIGVDESEELRLRTVGDHFEVEQNLVELDWQPAQIVHNDNDE